MACLDFQLDRGLDLDLDPDRISRLSHAAESEPSEARLGACFRHFGIRDTDTGRAAGRNRALLVVSIPPGALILVAEFLVTELLIDRVAAG